MNLMNFPGASLKRPLGACPEGKPSSRDIFVLRRLELEEKLSVRILYTLIFHVFPDRVFAGILTNR
ncbi:hypothetical protein [Anaerolactibacter massiliensis]|uniref:hypothetical protein n=1 Tax=Anaerolactibacter massiliensis TaxID=2044573 RepID=UPI001435500B|nr:hypothetical protein [Anaerolactibacter massiliensis]